MAAAGGGGGEGATAVAGGASGGPVFGIHDTLPPLEGGGAEGEEQETGEAFYEAMERTEAAEAMEEEPGEHQSVQ